jgi:hypothetical protein
MFWVHVDALTHLQQDIWPIIRQITPCTLFKSFISESNAIWACFLGIHVSGSGKDLRLDDLQAASMYRPFMCVMYISEGQWLFETFICTSKLSQGGR